MGADFGEGRGEGRFVGFGKGRGGYGGADATGSPGVAHGVWEDGQRRGARGFAVGVYAVFLDAPHLCDATAGPGAKVLACFDVSGDCAFEDMGILAKEFVGFYVVHMLHVYFMCPSVVAVVLPFLNVCLFGLVPELVLSCETVSVIATTLVTAVDALGVLLRSLAYATG